MNRVFAAVVVVAALMACSSPEENAVVEATPPHVAEPATAVAATESVATNDTVASAHAGANVTGSYVAMNELPADFAELDHLLLATIDENGEPAPLNGFLRPKTSSAPDYVLERPVLTGTHLTFTTRPVGGVLYAFDGAFETLADFAANPPDYDTAVLVGTLKKVRDGKQVASTPVRFRYEAGG